MAAIDVLMPMRDAARWVGKAWQTLARQTFRDWRLVAVDDGSRDHSWACLQESAGGDRRLHLVRQPPQGVAGALNRGLREVTAPVVARMDADDLAHPQRLEILWTFLRQRPDLAVVASRVRMFPGSAVSPAMAAYVEWQNGLLTSQEIRKERYVECTVAHGAAAFSTGALLGVGGWWEGEGPEDLDLFLRLHRAGVHFGKIPRVLYLWREHPGRETRTSARCSAAAFRRTKARHLAAEFCGQTSVRLLGRGRSLRDWARALQERGLGVTAAEYRPGEKVGDWPGMAVFCFGHPGVRALIRRMVPTGVEGRDYLFVA